MSVYFFRPGHRASAYTRKSKEQQKLEARHRQENQFAEQNKKYERFKNTYRKLFDRIETKEFEDWYFGVTGHGFLPSIFCITDIDFIRDSIEVAVETEELKKLGRKALIKMLYGREVSPSKQRTIIQCLATPKWADKNKIRQIYDYRAACDAADPQNAPYHVDHIIPIQGDSVCGLHVHENLRVIPRRENISKKNKFTEEMLDFVAYSW